MVVIERNWVRMEKNLMRKVGLNKMSEWKMEIKRNECKNVENEEI